MVEGLLVIVRQRTSADVCHEVVSNPQQGEEIALGKKALAMT